MCEAIKTGGYLPQCARRAGLDYSTVKDWMQRGKKGDEPFSTFRAAIQDAVADRELTYVQSVTDASVKDAKHAQWMLTHRYSKRWVDREKVDAELLHRGEVRVINVPKKRPV